MANKIQIKRGTICSSALAEGELGYNLSKNILYIGNDGNKAIGGPGAFLPLSGGTLTGPLTATQLTVNRSDNDYPTITFIPKSRSPLNSSFIQTNTNGTFGFYSYHPDQDTDDDAGRYYTGYILPGPTAGLNSGNVENGKGITYEILTEKKAVTVAQGGTGQDMAEAPANALIRMSSAGTFWYTASANGAVYATSANGAITFGTLPVAQGGTGKTTFTSGQALIGNGTGAITTRAITNNTTAGPLNTSGWSATQTYATALPTVNTLAFWDGAYSGNNSNLTKLGTITKGIWNSTAIGIAYGGTGQDLSAAPPNAIIRTSSTGTLWYTASAKGAVYATSANGAITFGTLPVAQGGTGVTAAKDLRDLVHNSYSDAGIANTVDVFTLAPGVYHLEETSSIEKNYPIAESRATVFIYGQFRAGTAADDGYPNGYWVIRILYGSGKEYINYRYWSVWKGWKQVHNDFNTISVEQGGTNAINATDARKNLGAFGFIGTNPITTTATDTTTAWKEKGLGYAWYSQSGQLNNQPSTYGFLLNYVNNGDIFQIWRAQSGGPTHWRSGNGSGWGNTWAKVYDELNKPTASELGVLPLAGGTMTGTITLHSTGFKTSSTSGYYTNQYGNFVHQVATTNQTWNICNNAGASKFAVDFESGYVTVKGLVNGTPISQNWILTSRSGAFRVEAAATGSAAAAALSMKVNGGSWAIANLATSSSLYFVFGSDENYNAGTNKSSTYYIGTDGIYSGYIDWSHVKNPLVTIAQGGTEATSVLGAQANLLTTDSSKITATTNLNTILQTGRFKMEGNASKTYNWPADASGARCLVIQEGALNSGTYGYWKQTAHMLGQHRTYSRNYHWDHWMEWKMDYNEETLVYSTSQPVNGYKGRIWLKPI